MQVTFALSTLCENPERRTGLSTLFQEFVRHSRRAFPSVGWIVFAGENEAWVHDDPAVVVVRQFPSNEHASRRLFCDHCLVAREAVRRGAKVLLTVGFFPLFDAGIPIVMHVFEVNHRREAGVRSWYRRNAVRRGLARARLVIVNSRWTQNQLGTVAAPLLVSPEGLDHVRFNPSGPAGLEGLPAGYFLWASNFYVYKHCERLLAAYARLPEALRATTPLVLVGGDWHGGRQRAEAAAERLGIAGQTRFLGWVADAVLPSLYRGARLHLLSSESETFGRSTLEAMACGCVSVLQDLPVFREVAGEAAVFVDYRDPAAAAAAIEELCTKPALLDEKRQQGFRQASQYTFERLARERVAAILGGLGGTAL